MIKHLIRRNPTLYLYLRLAVAFGRLLDSNFTNISSVASFNKQKPTNRQTIVLAGMVGINPDTLVQTLLGVALKYGGAEIIQLSCDSAMKLCFNSKSFHYESDESLNKLLRDGQGRICDICRLKSRRYAASASLRNLWIGSQLTKDDWSMYRQAEKLVCDEGELDALREFKFEGLHLGEHAYSATVRFFASPEIELESSGILVLREYLLSSIITALGFKRFLEKQAVDLVIVDHGIYVPQGVIKEIAKKQGIRVLTFNTGYRKSTFLFAEGDSYHFAIPRSKEFAARTYSDNQRRIALDYVKSRASGKSDWVHFQPQVVNRLINIDRKKTHVAVFPNVLWDADVHFEEALFASSSEWLLETIKHLGKNPDVVIHLRIHPGEKRGAVVSRFGISDLLRKKYVITNPNLLIYSAEDSINSYLLAEACDFSVVYGSKIGIDLAALGHRVLTAGDCWTRGKGITADPDSVEEYFNLLDSPSRIVPSEKRALDFAYYLYFEKMYLFNFVSKRSGDPPFSFNPEDFGVALEDEKSDINRLLRELLS